MTGGSPKVMTNARFVTSTAQNEVGAVSSSAIDQFNVSRIATGQKVHHDSTFH